MINLERNSECVLCTAVYCTQDNIVIQWAEFLANNHKMPQFIFKQPLTHHTPKSFITMELYKFKWQKPITPLLLTRFCSYSHPIAGATVALARTNISAILSSHSRSERGSCRGNSWTVASHRCCDYHFRNNINRNNRTALGAFFCYSRELIYWGHSLKNWFVLAVSFLFIRISLGPGLWLGRWWRR